MNKEYLLALLKSRAEYLTGQRNALTQELTLIADEISGMEKRIEADRLAIPPETIVEQVIKASEGRKA